MRALFEERVVSGFSMTSYGFFMAVLGAPAPFTLKANETYTVVWDGVEYVRTAFAFIDTSSGTPFVGIGNTILTDGISNSGEPFGITYNADFGDADGMFAFAIDTQESHTIGVYLPDPGIVLKDRNGDDMIYDGVTAIMVDTEDGGTQIFSKGVAEEGTVALDFSGGDMIVTPDEGKLFSALTIPVPDNLAAEHIAKDVVVAGIVGTHEGGGTIPYFKKLKYIIPITHEVTRYSTYGITLGETTITASENESVYVNLFPALNMFLWAGYRANQITYSLIRGNDYMIAQASAFFAYATTGMSTIGFSSHLAGKSATSGNSLTITPQYASGAGNGSIWTGTYQGMILVFDDYFIGETTILRENSYVTSENTMTVL